MEAEERAVVVVYGVIGVLGRGIWQGIIRVKVVVVVYGVISVVRRGIWQGIIQGGGGGVWCYRCGGKGHMARDYEGERRGNCYNCGQREHFVLNYKHCSLSSIGTKVFL